jgi:translation initiation factor 2B subunit (eIF-2B alpha/beta/delta family)
MHRELRAILTRARSDKLSGASEIALNAASDIERYVCTHEFGPDEIREFALGLVESQPNMAPLWNMSNDILLSDMSRSGICAICNRAMKHHSSAARAVGSIAARFLKGGLVATNSASSAVFEALVSASKSSSTGVLLTESRPKREGLAMAKRLGEAGLDVTLFSDASLSKALSRATCAVIGADAITSSGVVGKVGILNLALSAKEYGIESTVCADSSKFAPIRLVDVPHPGREIATVLSLHVRVENLYFEEAPHSRFSRYVTESEVLGPEAAKGRVANKKIADELMTHRGE